MADVYVRLESVELLRSSGHLDGLHNCTAARQETKNDSILHYYQYLASPSLGGGVFVLLSIG